MNISFDKKSSEIHVLRFEGDLDYHNSTEIREKLASFLDEKPPKIMLNLEKVPYMDSSAIAAFVELSQKARAYGASIVFYNLTEAVKNIFELAKLHLFFSIADSETEAARLLSA